MSDVDLLKKIKKSGFSNKEIKTLIKQSEIRKVSLQSVLYELYFAFPKLVKMHIILLVVIMSIIGINYTDIALDEIIALGIAYLLGCMIIQRSSPVKLSYKVYRYINKNKLNEV